MKRILFLGLVCVLSAGCGRGWLPLFRGAPCRGCAATSLPAPPQNTTNCVGCGTQSGYAPYENEIVYDSGAIVDDYYNNGVPPMTTLSE